MKKRHSLCNEPRFYAQNNLNAILVYIVILLFLHRNF